MTRTVVLLLATLLAAPASAETVKRLDAPPARRYRGEPVTLHVRDADLRDVLIVLAKLSKTSIAIDPGINGKVTLDLVDVPSDQALQLILAQNGLASVVEGRVARVRRSR